MAIAGTLELIIQANIARLTQDMAAVKSSVSGAMSNVEKSVEQAKGALASLGITLGAGAFAAMIRGTVDAADHLNDLTKSTALTIEQLAGLKIAAKQSGSDLDSIAAAITKLSVNIGKDGDKFKALGVSAKDPLEAFKQLADIFVATEDPAQRAAVAAAALGKSWAGAAPLLAEGSAKIGEMVKVGSELSGVTAEMGRQSDEFNDKLVLLTGTNGLMNRTVASLLPLLNQLADELLEAQKMAKGAGESGFSPLAETLRAVIVLGGNVAFVFRGIGTDIGAMAAQLAALASGDFAAFRLIGQEVTADAAKARAAFDAWERNIMQVGDAASIATAKLDGMDQVSRRMASEARARAAAEQAERAKASAEQAKRNAAFLGDAKAAKDLEAAYNAVIRSIKEKTAATERLLAGEDKLTDGEKLQLDITLKLADGTLKVTDAQRGNLATLIELMLASERSLKIRQQEIEFALSYAKLLDDLDDAKQRDIAGNVATVESIQAANDQMVFEISILGKTGEALALANVERAREIALRGVTSPLAIARINQLYDEQRGLAVVGEQMKLQLTMADQLAAAWRNAGADIADSLTKAFGAGGASLGAMIKAYADGAAQRIDIDERYRKAREAGGADLVALDRRQQEETLQNSLKTYGDMAGAASGFFDKQSDGYKILIGIEKAMYAVRFAMQAEAMIRDLFFTTSSVANSGTRATADGIAAVAKTLASVPFPYNIAAGAVVVAALAAIGVSMSGGIGGGGGGGQSAAEVQKTQGTGTVLGDASAKSNSLADSLKAIESLTAVGLTYTKQMAASLQSIQYNMAGLASIIYRTTGITSGSGFDASMGTTRGMLDPGIQRLGLESFDIQGQIFKWLSQYDPLLNKVMGWIGGSSTSNITDSGIKILGRLSDLVNGIGAQQYINVHTDTRGPLGGLFGGNGSTDEVQYRAIGGQLAQQIGLIFGSIADAVEAAAKGLGVWFPALSDAIKNFVVDTGNISLKDLKGQELQDALNSIFSTASDQLAMAAVSFGDFGKYIQAGEGFFQTIVRIAAENEVARQAFDALGWTMTQTGVAATQARIDMVELAGGADAFTKTVTDYYAKFYAPKEQHDYTGRALSTEFDAMGLTLPKTVEGFRALVDSVGTATPEAQALTLQLMKLGPTFFDFATSIVGLDGQMHTLDETTKQRIGLQQALDVATGAKSQRQVENENRRAAAIDATSLAIINQTIAAEDANARRAARSALEIQMLQAMGLAEQANARIRDEAIIGMTAEEVAIYDANVEMAAMIDNLKAQAALLATRKTLEIELMAAQGNAAGALAAQRALDIAGMNAAQVALYDYNASLRAQIQTAKDAAAAAKEQGTLDQQLAVLRGEQTQQQVDRANAWTAALSAGARETLAAIWAEQDLAAARKTAADIAAAQAALDDRLAVATGARTSQDVARAREWAAATTDQARATLVAIYAAEDAAAAAKTWSDALHAMEQSAGVSFSTLTEDIKKTLLGQMSQADLGTAMADMIVGGVYNAMATKTAERVTGIIDQYLIEPIMASILNGTSVTAAINATLTQANIDAMVAAATNAVTALTAVFSDPAFVTAMNALKVVISGVTATIQSSLTTLGNVDPGHGPARAGLPGEIWIDTGGGYGYWTQDPNYTSPGAATDAAKLLNDKLELQAQIFALTGDAAAAAAVLEKQHAIALAALDPSLRALQTQLWGLQAAAEAAAKAAELAKSRRDLEIQLQQALGNDALALAMQRADILAGMDASLRGLQQQVWDALDAQKLKDATKQWTDALQTWLQGSLLDSTLSPLTASQRLDAAQQQYVEDLLKAQGGDAAARGRFTGDADAYLREALAMFGRSSTQYEAIWRAIQDQTHGLIDAGLGPTAQSSVQDVLYTGQQTAQRQADDLLAQVRTLTTKVEELTRETKAQTVAAEDHAVAIVEATDRSATTTARELANSGGGGRLSTR